MTRYQLRRGRWGESEELGYTPIEEKSGFWRNHGNAFVASLFAFAFALFFLGYGWSHGLSMGGPQYYLIALAGVALTAALPVHIYRRYRRMTRIVEAIDM